MDNGVGRYEVQWRYSSLYLTRRALGYSDLLNAPAPLEAGQVIELEVSLAEAINRDSPGVLRPISPQASAEVGLVG
ncbi:MAG: hypothetical protein ACRDVM_03525 [Acidimicrobiia bacterium]